MLFDEAPSVELEFEGEVVSWRGPSPYHFVAIPDEASREIGDVSSLATYGWGAIPVTARIGETEWTTSLFPKDGRYLLPVRDAIRRAEDLELGQSVAVWLGIALARLGEPGA